MELDYQFFLMTQHESSVWGYDILVEPIETDAV